MSAKCPVCNQSWPSANLAADCHDPRLAMPDLNEKSNDLDRLKVKKLTAEESEEIERFYLEVDTDGPELAQFHQRKRKAAYLREYRKRPEARRRNRERKADPKYKEGQRIYMREYSKTYTLTPESVEKKKVYQKSYLQRPEVKARRRELQRKYRAEQRTEK